MLVIAIANILLLCLPFVQKVSLIVSFRHLLRQREKDANIWAKTTWPSCFAFLSVFLFDFSEKKTFLYCTGDFVSVKIPRTVAFFKVFLKEQFTLENLYLWLTFYYFMSTYLGNFSFNMGRHPIFAENFSQKRQYFVSSTDHYIFFRLFIKLPIFWFISTFDAENHMHEKETLKPFFPSTVLGLVLCSVLSLFKGPAMMDRSIYIQFYFIVYKHLSLFLW